MGNLCSSGSERVDKNEEKRVPEILKDGEDEALLPRIGADGRLVTGKGSDSGGRVESAGGASKIMENGQCVMGAGISVCPEIVVSSSDVESVKYDDDDDDDFLSSVIAAATETSGRAVDMAHDVVADIEPSKPPQDKDVGFPEVTRPGEAVADADNGAVGAPVINSRASVSTESGNWSDNVVMSATTAAQNAVNGTDLETDELTTKVVRKEGSLSLSATEENSSDTVVMTSNAGDVRKGEAELARAADRSEAAEEVSQMVMDSVSVVSVGARHIVENGIQNRGELNGGSDSPGQQNNQGEDLDPLGPQLNKGEDIGLSGPQVISGEDLDPLGPQLKGGEDIGLSGPHLSSGEDLGSSVDGSFPKAGGWVKFEANSDGCEQRVLDEASAHKNSSDASLDTPAGRKQLSSSGYQNGAHEEGYGSSVDAQVNTSDTRQTGTDQNIPKDAHAQDKMHISACVPSSLETEVGLLDSETSNQLKETSASVANDADRNTVNAYTTLGIGADNKQMDNCVRDQILTSTFGSEANRITLEGGAFIGQQWDGDNQLASNATTVSSSTQYGKSEEIISDGQSVVAVIHDLGIQENSEEKSGQDSSDTLYFLQTVSPQTSQAEKNFLDRSITQPETKSQSEADIFPDWSTISDANIPEAFLKSPDELDFEAAAREIVERIIVKAISMVCESQMESGLKDLVPTSNETEEESLANKEHEEIHVSKQTPDRADVNSPTELFSPLAAETDQPEYNSVEESVRSVSVSQGDLIEIEGVLIPTASPDEIFGEVTNTHIFGSCSDDSDEDASIKLTAWGITDKAVQEAIKLISENGCHIKTDAHQINSKSVNSFSDEDATVAAESSSVLPETTLNNDTDTVTHTNGVKPFPPYTAQITVTSHQQPLSQSEITAKEDSPTRSVQHTVKSQKTNPVDAQDSPTDANPVTSPDTELVSSSSPFTSNGQQGISESQRQTSLPYVSKVPLFFPPLDNISSLSDKPLIIINSPDSAAQTGSTEDISVHVEALI